MIVSKDFIEQYFKWEKFIKSFVPDGIWAGYTRFENNNQVAHITNNEQWSDEVVSKDLIKKAPIAGPIFAMNGDACVEKWWDEDSDYVKHRKKFIGASKGLSRVIKKGHIIESVTVGFDDIYYDHKTLLNLLTEVLHKNMNYNLVLTNNLFI